MNKKNILMKLFIVTFVLLVFSNLVVADDYCIDYHDEYPTLCIAVCRSSEVGGPCDLGTCATNGGLTCETDCIIYDSNTNTCVTQDTCGDGYITGSETCEGPWTCTPATGQTTCQLCSSSTCTYETYTAPSTGSGTSTQTTCGNGVLDFLEICDHSSDTDPNTNNGVACTPASGETTCKYCSSNCQGFIVVDTKPITNPVCCFFDFSTSAYIGTGLTTNLPLTYAYVVNASNCNYDPNIGLDYSGNLNQNQINQELLYGKILENCKEAPFCSGGMFDFTFWNPKCIYGPKNISDTQYTSYASFYDKGCNMDCSFNVCGDGIKLGSNEECDDGTDLGLDGKKNYDTSSPPTGSYGETISYCTNTCKIASVIAGCGDGKLDVGYEQCDGTDLGQNSCGALGLFTSEDSSAKSCDSECKLLGCDDVEWWTVIEGELTTETGKLKPISSNAKIQSDPFDMLIGKDYTLSANIENLGLDSKVILKISSECYSSTGSIMDCGIISTPLEFTVDGQKSQTIKLTANSHSMNSGTYFRGVKLIVETTGSAKISDISLKDPPAPDVHFDYPLPETTLTGCCPTDFCWDGNVCVDSALWMNDPMYPPLWNLINISGFIDNHTFEENRSKATGYRCVLDGSGIAVWEPAYIKYDWNFKESGYCSNVTDCFVGYTDPDFDHQYASRGCIPDGEIISDNFVEKTGNHYCYQGNWTTKSYMISLLLQDIAKSDASGDERYTLSCYDDLDMQLAVPQYVAQNIEGTSFSVPTASGVEVVSSCIMTKPQDIDDQIILGVVLEESDSSKTQASQFLNAIINDFNQKYSASANVIDSCLTSSAVLLKNSKGQDSDFTLCVDANVEDATGDDIILKVYYNAKYDYFLVSNSQIENLEDSPIFRDVWLAISGFFEDIFTKDVVVETYNSLSYTTSYDRLFILRDVDANTTALEEQKYDEDEKTIVTVLFVNYTGSLYSENPINSTQLNKLLKEDAEQNSNIILKTTYNPSLEEPQELFVKSHSNINEDSRTGIWPYFTTVLRIDGTTLPDKG